MPTVEILKSHPLAHLRDEVRSSNEKLGVIQAYKKGMTKGKLIELMMKHKARFHHIEMYVKPPPKPATAQEIKDSQMANFSPSESGPKDKTKAKPKAKAKAVKKITTPAGIKVDLEKAKKAGIKVKK